MRKKILQSFFALLTLQSFAYQVTFIGDSHSDFYGNKRGSFGFLGQRLKELLEAKNYTFNLFGASGSSPTWWFDDTPKQAGTWGYTQTSINPSKKTCYRGSKSGTCIPKLGIILSKAPDLFIIEQGTNMLGGSSSTIISNINKMMSQIQGKQAACLWVGAPNARTSVHSSSSQNNLWSLIKQYAGKYCYVYDSRFIPRTDSSGRPVLDANKDLIMDVPLPYSPDANNDGEHLGMTAAGKWAAGVNMMIENIRANP